MGNKLKTTAFKLVEKGSFGSRINLLFDYFIILLIICNVIALAVESTSNLDPHIKIILKSFEFFSVIIFTLEFLLRIYVSDLTHPSKNRIKSAIKFVFSPYGLIDLFAILPFYLPVVFAFDLRFIRILRLIRFLRLLKISRYNNSLKLIGSVIKDKRTELGMTVFVTCPYLIVASFLMYNLEGNLQPDKFPNVFASMWWAIVTMTTIGYGDVYPITSLGKILSGIIAMLGIGLVALPTGIISAGFMERINKTKSEKKITICPHCGNEIDQL